MFKIGDKVICIESVYSPDTHLIKGSQYTVCSIINNNIALKEMPYRYYMYTDGSQTRSLNGT